MNFKSIEALQSLTCGNVSCIDVSVNFIILSVLSKSQQHLNLAFCYVLVEIFNSLYRVDDFHVDMSLKPQIQGWVVRNNKRIIYSKVIAIDFLGMRFPSRIWTSMHIQTVGIFCDFCTLSKLFGEVFGTFVSIHARALWVHISTRSMNILSCD